MCFVIDDYAKIWTSSKPKARKQYSCYECRRPICVGEVHESIGYMQDRGSGWERVRICMQCVSLRHAVEAHELAEGCDADESTPPLGDLWVCAIEAGIVSRHPRNKRDERWEM